ncbi:hypothetical protein ACLMJK_009381 [Lecanora helva]
MARSSLALLLTAILSPSLITSSPTPELVKNDQPPACVRLAHLFQQNMRLTKSTGYYWHCRLPALEDLSSQRDYDNSVVNCNPPLRKSVKVTKSMESRYYDQASAEAAGWVFGDDNRGTWYADFALKELEAR